MLLSAIQSYKTKLRCVAMILAVAFTEAIAIYILVVALVVKFV